MIHSSRTNQPGRGRIQTAIIFSLVRIRMPRPLNKLAMPKHRFDSLILTLSPNLKHTARAARKKNIASTIWRVLVHGLAFELNSYWTSISQPVKIDVTAAFNEQCSPGPDCVACGGIAVFCDCERCTAIVCTYVGGE